VIGRGKSRKTPVKSHQITYLWQRWQ